VQAVRPKLELVALVVARDVKRELARLALDCREPDNLKRDGLTVEDNASHPVLVDCDDLAAQERAFAVDPRPHGDRFLAFLHGDKLPWPGRSRAKVRERCRGRGGVGALFALKRLPALRHPAFVFLQREVVLKLALAVLDAVKVGSVEATVALHELVALAIAREVDAEPARLAPC